MNEVLSLAQGAVSAAQGGGPGAGEQAARFLAMAQAATDAQRAVARARSMDALYQGAWGKQARLWIEEGLVDGPAEYRRLFALGGPDALVEAMREIQAFQEVDADLGEN